MDLYHVAVFGGDRCETDLTNNCDNDTCANIDFCRDLLGSADCVCPSDSKYTGSKYVSLFLQWHAWCDGSCDPGWCDMTIFTWVHEAWALSFFIVLLLYDLDLRKQSVVPWFRKTPHTKWSNSLAGIRCFYCWSTFTWEDTSNLYLIRRLNETYLT